MALVQPILSKVVAHLIPGAVWVSGIIFGWGPNWAWPPSSVSMGVDSPMLPVAGISPSGATLAAPRTSPWPGRAFQDSTSAMSVAWGEEAGGGDPLSVPFRSSEFPEDEDRWWWV